MNNHKVLGKTLEELIKINKQDKVKGFIGDVEISTEQEDHHNQPSDPVENMTT